MFNILSANDGHLVFELSNVTISFANGIRRCCLVEVPIVAIDPTSISFSSDDDGINSTSVHDEYIAHRIAEMPVNIDPAYSQKYKFRICDSTDPTKPWHNTSDAIVNFTSSNIEVLYENKKLDNNKVFLNDILILRVKPDQKLKTNFSAVYRSVRQNSDAPMAAFERHMRWSPCLVKYKFKTPQSSSQTIESGFHYLGHEIKQPHTIVMEVKTFGYTAIRAQDVVRQAIEILGNKCKRVFRAIKEHDDSVIEEYSDPDLPQMRIIQVRDEDHTLGNLLVSGVMDIQKDYSESFVAYSKTHPLDNDLLIKLRPKNGMSARSVLSLAAQKLVSEMNEAVTQWQHVCRKQSHQ